MPKTRANYFTKCESLSLIPTDKTGKPQRTWEKPRESSRSSASSVDAVPSLVAIYLRWQRISFPRALSLCQTLACRSRSAQGEEQNVHITNDRQEKRMVNTDTIGNRTLRYRNNCPANDGHDHDSGTVPRERSKFGHSQREDAGEHDRIKQTDKDDAVHGKVSCTQHRDGDRRPRAHGPNPNRPAGTYLLQDGGADEATDHRSPPVESDKTSRNFVRQTADLGLGEVVHEKAADGNFRAHIYKDGDRAEDQIGMFPDRVVHLLPDLVLSMLDLRQFKTAHGHRQQYQRDAQTDVGHLDRRCLMQAVSLQGVGCHRSNISHRLWSRTQNQPATEERR